VLEAGKHAFKIDYADDNTVTLSVDNEQAAKESITARNKYLGAASSEGISVGKDLNSPVTKSYPGAFPFTGRVITLVVDQKTE